MTTRIPRPDKAGIFNRKEGIIIGVVLFVALVIIAVAIITIGVSRRDSQIANDANTVLSSMQQFAGDHSGVYPSATVINISELKKTYNLPDGYNYSYGTSSSNKEDMIISDRDCSGRAGASVHYFIQNGGAKCLQTQ